MELKPPLEVKTFDTGATRSSDNGKPDYEGYFSPLVFHRYGQYMVKHQVQADGDIRASDNWQKGITLSSYMKSLWRHFMDVWMHHRGYSRLAVEDLEESLVAEMFNAHGYLHEILKSKYEKQGEIQNS